MESRGGGDDDPYFRGPEGWTSLDPDNADALDHPL